MKKLLFVLITFLTLLNIDNVYAGGYDDSDYVYIDKLEEGINLRLSKENENYGVNKKIDINSNNISNIKKTPLVDSSLLVYDFSDVLDTSEINDLKNRSLEFTKKTGITLVIVTINESYSDHQIEEFADDFMDYNDFGTL